ncbi:unnamed protein product [Pleuronectes platessa]|uniref:Uncharacterized protein n=1 Tax=Pleuronectes platessa TaxID=8262 RepID=A0A9N7YRQ7_PLEPL|nr:unnamed protein product [Pleuronectes platessa]
MLRGPGPNTEGGLAHRIQTVYGESSSSDDTMTEPKHPLTGSSSRRTEERGDVSTHLPAAESPADKFTLRSSRLLPDTALSKRTSPPSPSESAWFTYTRLSSKSDIQDQSGHPREPQPAERLSEPPSATLIFKPLLRCQLTSPSNGTGRGWCHVQPAFSPRRQGRPHPSLLPHPGPERQRGTSTTEQRYGLEDFLLLLTEILPHMVVPWWRLFPGGGGSLVEVVPWWRWFPGGGCSSELRNHFVQTPATSQRS